MPAVVVAGATDTSVATVVWQQITPVITASGSAAGFPAININDPATWSSWKADGSNGWTKYDLGGATSIDAIGIAAHNLFTSGVTQIVIASSTDDASYTNRVTHNVASDADLLFLIEAQTARYWRVTLTGPAANIGILQVGKRLVFPNAPLDDYTPLNMAREYTKLRNQSLKGQLLGNRVIAAGAITDVDLGYVTRTWADTNLPAFKSHYDQGGTFFYAGCPSKFPLDMGYCWSDGDDDTIAVSYVEADRLSTVSFAVRSYVPQ